MLYISSSTGLLESNAFGFGFFYFSESRGRKDC